jgi:competence protein ComEC
MTDLAVLVLAASVAIAALVAVPVSPVVAWATLLTGLAVVATGGGTPAGEAMPWSRRLGVVVVAVGLCLIVAGRSQQSLRSMAAPLPPRVDGVAQLVTDPESQRFGVQFIVRVQDRRYQARVDPEQAAAVRDLLAGERVRLVGRPTALRGAPEGWVRSRHLAGALEVEQVGAVAGTPWWYRAANGVHRTISAGAAPLGAERGALYTGLVMGDDRAQDELTRFRFEAAGLTHLLAVSGQNVAFVLAVAAPLLRRLHPSAALAAAFGVLVLFALVTRAEPSVLRASVMAALGLMAVHRGRIASGVRLVGLTATALVLVDPMLVHSVGFRLSLAATLGLLVLAAPIAQRLPGPQWLTLPLGVTLAAQLATAPLLWGFDGALPAAATPANLLAVPAAGLVMMLGVTVGLAAGMVREPVAAVLQVPSDLLVRWIGGVASAATRSPLPVLDAARVALLGAAVGVGSLAVRQWAGAPRRSEATGATRVRPGRRLVTLVLVAALAGVLWPNSPPAGTSSPGGGARLVIDPCGATAVELGAPGVGRVEAPDVVEGLWRVGVRRIDVLVVHDGVTSFRAASTLRSQFSVTRVVTPAERAPPDVEPLAGRSWSVGGLLIREDGVISPSGRPCSV